MSDKTSARNEHKGSHRKHSESNKVLRTITFVLTPFLVFAVVCGIFVIGLYVPYNKAKPYLDVVFDPNTISNKTDNQVSIYHPDDVPVRIDEVEDSQTNEKHKVIYPYYGDLYGTLTISSIGLQDTPIYCGTSDSLLAKGVGWSNSSVFIGRIGNVVIAGHNHTHFALLSQCKEGDIVIVDTDFCKLTYIVKETAIFHKSDLTYVRPTYGKDRLTLYTCWNNGMLGATDYRIAALCDLVSREWKDVDVSK